jgi:hypothetical protein
MIAAFRQPTYAPVTGLPSAVMNRPAAGSPSIAVFGKMSALRHDRRINRSVSTTGPANRGNLAPGFRGGIIDFLALCFLYFRDYRGQCEQRKRRSDPDLLL